jgi:predicted permease
MMMRAWLWVRSNLLRRRMEREMREEMATHLERATERYVAGGLPQAAARHAAEREFGNIAYLQEEARYARGTVWLDGLAADVQFALRQFRRRPGTTAVMFLVLILGISISTLLFSYVQSYATQPPVGVRLDDGLVRIRGSMDVSETGRGSRPFGEDEFGAYVALSDHFEAVAGWTFASAMVDAGSSAEGLGLEARITFVTDNYFPVLGVAPQHGAGLPADASSDPSLVTTAVISHDAWQRLYGGRTDVAGSRIDVNGVPVTVVGVAPPRFSGVGGHIALQLWMPLEARHVVLAEAPAAFRAAARLRDGVSMAAAAAAVEVVAERTAGMMDQKGVTNPATDVVPLLSANGDPMFDRDVRIMTFAVSLLALIVLAVVCTNVSALLTGMASSRRQEIATRLSLGASRRRIIRQLLTESALLAAGAGGAALAVSAGVLHLAGMLLTFIPLEMGLSVRATTFTFGVALLVGILFGLSPALHATRIAIATAMRDGAGATAAARGRLQRGLVVAQIAFTQPLIVLLAASLVLVLSQFRPERESEIGDRLVRIYLRDALTGSSAESAARNDELNAMTQRLIDRLHAVTGVEAAVKDWQRITALQGSYVPEADGAGAVDVTAEKAPPGYFSARGISIERGREFAAADVAAAASQRGDMLVIIDAGLARRLWGSADPLGRRLNPASDTAPGARSLRVVGVVDYPAARQRRSGDAYGIWVPAGSQDASMRLLVRTGGDARPLLPDIRTAVRDEMPGMVASVRTVSDIEAYNVRTYRTIAGSLLGAGGIALLLCGIGLYAVIAFAVGERTREIAVRVAIGAGYGQLVRSFVGNGLHLTILGLAIGMPFSLLGLHLILGTDPDIPHISMPAVTGIAAAAVLIVALAAVWVPARRAAAVDPALTLRSP